MTEREILGARPMGGRAVGGWETENYDWDSNLEENKIQLISDPDTVNSDSDSSDYSRVVEMCRN